MDTLVLDTIHGGTEIAQHLRSMGHEVDAIDVYRGKKWAVKNVYDVLIAPVHLDPGHPLLTIRAEKMISHHEAVRWILEGRTPHPMVEITGAQGKTTTACALASLMGGPGILHTSQGTFSFPDRNLLWRKSITPASTIAAALAAHERRGWLIAEESLGVTGAGDIGVITSDRDYPIANKKKSALIEKLKSLQRMPEVVTIPEIKFDHQHSHSIDEVTQCKGRVCEYRLNSHQGEFSNSLLELAAYRIPLRLATTIACLLRIDPKPLERFQPIEGRMALYRRGGVVIVDNANSGTDLASTIEAAQYARTHESTSGLTLVIGEISRTICEGFSATDVERAIQATKPDRVILVGERVALLKTEIDCHFAASLEEGLEIAQKITPQGSIVLAVKMWR